MSNWSVALAGLAGGGSALMLLRRPRGARAARLLAGPLPGRRMDGRLRRRERARIASALPDMLELTAAAVGAGLGLDAAWAAILEGPPAAPPHPLHDEMARYLSAIRLGASRADALAGMAARTGLADVTRLGAALLQAERHGIGLNGVLQGQAAAIRSARRQRARRQAQEAPVRLLFPLVLGMFPALLVVTLGPPALKVWEVFSRQAGN